MPVIGGRARPLAGAAAGVPLGDWGLAGVPPSVALPDSADDWDSEEGMAGAVVAVVLAIFFSLRFSFLSFFFFLRSFFNFFFSKFRSNCQRRGPCFAGPRSTGSSSPWTSQSFCPGSN
uniref:Uncharacterized protein n=1 Tax=Ixodes ricinus TaxID=34613 RepID=A0A6B0UMX5_IXORI